MARFKFLELLEAGRVDAPDMTPVVDTDEPVAPCPPDLSPDNTATDIEQARYQSRLFSFVSRGVDMKDAQAVALRLIERDKERDDRRSCAECGSLWQGRCIQRLEPIGGFHIEVLHRCKSFKEVGIGVGGSETMVPMRTDGNLQEDFHDREK